MKVVFLDTVHPVLWERLEASGYHCFDATEMNLEACKEAIIDASGLVIRSRFPVGEDLLRHAPDLRFIARSGAGMENIDEPYCQSRNIELFNAPEGNRNAVAEHALGMLLSLFNRIPLANQEVRSGKWDREGNRGIELDGKTVGIIGYGNNGGAFARKLRGFEVKVLAYDKYKSGFGDTFVTEATMEDIYSNADVLSFHIPQNEETLFLADETFFGSFRKPIFLINLARGKIVRTSALISALDQGKVLGACLDVLEHEKASFESMFDGQIDPSFAALLKSDKVLLSPHVGGWTHESYFKLSDVLADKILGVFNNDSAVKK